MRSACSLPVNHVPSDSLVLDARTDCDTVTPGEPFHVLLTLSLRPTKSTSFSRNGNTNSHNLFSVTHEPGVLIDMSAAQGVNSCLVPLEPSTQQTMVFLPAVAENSSSSSHNSSNGGGGNDELLRCLGSSTSSSSQLGGAAKVMESALSVRTPLVVIEKMTVRFDCTLKFDGAGFHVPIELTSPTPSAVAADTSSSSSSNATDASAEEKRKRFLIQQQQQQQPLSSFTLFECAASSPHHLWQVKPSEPLTVCFTATIPRRAMPSHTGCAAKIRYTLNSYVSWKAVLDPSLPSSSSAGSAPAPPLPRVSTPRSLQMTELHMPLPVVRRSGAAVFSRAALGGGGGGGGMHNFFGDASTSSSSSSATAAVAATARTSSDSMVMMMSSNAAAVPFLSFREKHLRHDFRARLQLISGSTAPIVLQQQQQQAASAASSSLSSFSATSAAPSRAALSPSSAQNAAANAAPPSRLPLSSDYLAGSAAAAAAGLPSGGLFSTSGALPLEVPVVVDGEPLGVLLLSCTDIRIGSVWRAAFTPAPLQVATGAPSSLAAASGGGNSGKHPSSNGDKKHRRRKSCALIQFFFDRDELVSSKCVRSGCKVPESAVFRETGGGSASSTSSSSSSSSWIVTERHTILESQLFTLDDINGTFFSSAASAGGVSSTDQQQQHQQQAHVASSAAAPTTLDLAIHPSQVSPSLLTDFVRVVWRLRCVFAVVDVASCANYVTFNKPQPGEHVTGARAAGAGTAPPVSAAVGITPNRGSGADSLGGIHHHHHHHSSVVAPFEAYSEVALFGKTHMPVSSTEMTIPINML